MPKERIDKLLVDLGLAPSRERARALIMSGSVLADEAPITKAGTQIDTKSVVRLRGEDIPYVSRGGLKLEGALDDLDIDVRHKTILDIGASTGGFTDCCLKRGASRVYAVDVGTNQLAYSLRKDSRVLVFENTNARYLSPSALPTKADLCVIDVSFISITKLLEPITSCLTPSGTILAMVKPQFEVGRNKVGKGGVVKSDELREEAVGAVVECAENLGFKLVGRCDSKVHGPKGNREIFTYFKQMQERTD